MKWGWIFLLSIAAVSVSCAAPNPERLKQYDFTGGLNSYYSPLTIADNEVQNALNVFFDKDNAVTKMQGFTVYGSTAGVQFNAMFTYTDATGQPWLIVVATDAIRASPGTGVFSVQIATLTATSKVSMVDAQGNAYFVDQNQGVYYWNGTSTTYVAGSPSGSLIDEFHGRIWVAGLAFPSQNFLYGSAYLDGTRWGTGPLATDPVTYQVGLDDRGEGITALFSGVNDTNYLLKTFSIWALYGFDQTDFQIRVLSRDAGCIDGQSVQPYHGNLQFLSARGVESFDGYSPTRISLKVKDKIDPATTNNVSQKTWTQDTPSDFGSGSFPVNSFYGDTVTVSGKVEQTFPDSFSSFRNGTNGTLPVWTAYKSGTLCSGTTAIFASGGLNIPNPGSGSGCGIGWNNAHTNILANFQQGTTYHVVLNSMPNDAGNLSRFAITLSSISYATDNGTTPSALTNEATLTLYSRTANTIDQSDLNFNGSFPCTSCGTGSLPLTIDLFVATTTWQLSFNGSVVNSGTHSWPANPVAAYLSFEKASSGAGTAVVSDFGLTPENASFTSQIHNIGTDITSFGNFNTMQDLTNGGNIAWGICTSANSNMNPQTCKAQTVNGQILNSTAAYVTVTSTFSITNATQTPNFGLFTVNWNAGTARPRVASAVFDDRYYLSLATSTADSSNEAVMVYSLWNGKPCWTMTDWHVGAFAIYKNQLYHGDSDATGNVYSDFQGYAENGNPINAFIKTRDYAFNNLNQDDFIEGLYVNADNLGNYSLLTSYATDKATFSYTLDTITQNEQPGIGFTQSKLYIPIDASHQNFGRTFNFTFANNLVNQPMNLYGFEAITKERPEIGNTK